MLHYDYAIEVRKAKGSLNSHVALGIDSTVQRFSESKMAIVCSVSSWIDFFFLSIV